MFLHVSRNKIKDGEDIVADRFIPVDAIKELVHPTSPDDPDPGIWYVFYEGVSEGESELYKSELLMAYAAARDVRRLIRATSLKGAVSIPAQSGDMLNGEPVQSWLLGLDGVAHGVAVGSGSAPRLIYGSQHRELEDPGSEGDVANQGEPRDPRSADVSADVSAALAVRQAPIKKVVDDW